MYRRPSTSAGAVLRRKPGDHILARPRRQTSGLAAPASPAALASHPIVAAVRHGDCDAAVKLVNTNLASNDDQTVFLAARMLNEGICVRRNTAQATDFFARAADLGDRSAGLDCGSKVGLGDGTEQSYERAGDLCRAAGLDPQSRLSRYSLGYACTVGGVAARLLHETLPRGAFQGSPAAVILEFSPASAQMHIRSTPHVRLADANVGSNLRQPVVNAQHEVEKAWHDALAAVPRPDTTQLDDQVIQLSLDVDMALEDGRDAGGNKPQPSQILLPGEIRRE